MIQASLRNSSRWLALLLFLAGDAGLGGSRAASEAASSRTRQEQLAKVRELIADPDPLMRLSNLEAIVTAGDAVRTQIAIRAAITSDDADLRGLAMRAYLATHRELTLTIEMNDEEQKIYEAAETDPDKLRQLVQQHRWASIAYTNASRLHLVIASYKFAEEMGTLVGEGNPAFTLSGDRFSTAVRVSAGVYGLVCFVELRPTIRATFEGTLACKESGPALKLVFQVF